MAATLDLSARRCVKSLLDWMRCRLDDSTSVTGARSGLRRYTSFNWINSVGFYLLSFADGKHSLADLSRMIGGKSRPPEGMLKAVNELAAVGILEVRHRYGTSLIKVLLVDNLVMPEEGSLELLDVHPHLGLLSLAAVAEADGHTLKV